jgi:hypothetical protein
MADLTHKPFALIDYLIPTYQKKGLNELPFLTLVTTTTTKPKKLLLSGIWIITQKPFTFC